jgi:hypothetical protein
MGAKDLFHNAVKVALQKEQWVIVGSGWYEAGN